MADTLSIGGINKYLENKELFEISIFDSVSSTNLLAKESAQKGEKQGRVIIAEGQTGGRGRLGRSFSSPAGSGIYMSILLRPNLPYKNAIHITAAAAVAVSEAAEMLSQKSAQIKWVNDILIDGKKVCGILTEGAINQTTEKFDWAVLGIGINLYEPQGGFDPEIKDIASAIFEKEQPELKCRLTAEVLNRFWQLYNNLESRSFFEDYKKRLITLGKPVTVISGDKKRPAFCHDIDSECRLLVEYDNGEREYVSSGEISVRPESYV